MTVEHKDFAGQDIVVGSYIAYSALNGRSPTIKLGKVVRLASKEEQRYYNQPKKEVGTVRVRSVDRNWSDVWELQRNGGEQALGYLDRLFVIPPNSVPLEAKFLLDLDLDTCKFHVLDDSVKQQPGQPPPPRFPVCKANTLGPYTTTWGAKGLYKKGKLCDNCADAPAVQAILNQK